MVFIGEGDSTGENKAYNSPQGGSDGWDGLQREQEVPINQFCSSYN